LSITANDPDLLNGQPPERVAALQKASAQYNHAGLEYLMRDATNWAVISASAPAWAARVFPTRRRRNRKPGCGTRFLKSAA
jgi:aminopeptidase